ncbi:MAG: hypothetical protein ACE5IF_01940 [Candidatus Bathyarchaeia archaeon]
MSAEKKDDDDPVITDALCDAYRKALEDKILGLDKNIEKVDGRLWKVLASTILTAVLALIGVLVNLLS